MNYGDWLFAPGPARGRLRGWANDWESALLPFDPNSDPSAAPVVGVRMSANGRGSYRPFGEPPAAAGRECALCPTILSRWNTATICGPCERAARDIYPPLVLDPESVVYYGRRGDLIKIGTTIDLKTRLRVVGVELLATEPGGYRQETIRHKQFAHLNEVGEWFHPGADLVDHIAALAGAQEAAA